MDQNATTDLLTIDKVCVSFGGLDVLTDVSLGVQPGSVLGIIGPNGAGKTTLFNVVCGFTKYSRGSINFDGRPLRGHRPHDLSRLGIARTLQGLGLFGRLTVLDNVLAGLTPKARSRPLGALFATPWAEQDERRLREHALAALRMLDIADDADRPCDSLPYGVRKRIALARALVCQPRLLMLDEPASGLSATEAAELDSLIRSLRDNTTVLLVEHHMDFVMGLSDRVAVLDFGHLIANGTPDEIRADPAVQRAYLGETLGKADA